MSRPTPGLPELLDQAWRDLDPLRPVPPDDPRGWYVDLSEARGPLSTLAGLVRSIRRRADRPLRVLLLGHSGAGKSTEINRLRRLLEGEGWRCALVETDRELDREDLDIAEIQLLLVDRVGALLRELDLELDPATLDRLGRWFDLRDAESVQEVATTREAGTMQKVFGTLIAEWKAEVRVSETRRRVLRRRVRQRLRDFVELVHDVVAEANGLLQQHDFRGLVLLVDGVEKAALSENGLQRTTRILVEQVEQWARLPVNLVLTAPLQLLRESTRIQSHYDKYLLVPSIPVLPRPDRPAEPPPPYVARGRRLLADLVRRRAPVEAIFERPELLDPLITASGGSIRDLFILLREAIDAAEPGRPIGQAAVEAAMRVHRLQVELAVQPEDVEPLRSLLADPEALHYDATGIRLLQKELALHYINGGSWFGVHPAVVPRIRR